MIFAKNTEERNYARRYAKEFNIFRFFVQIFAVSVSYPFLKIVYRVKIVGQENLPKKGRYIYTANHVSMFDPLLLSLAVKRPIAYMAKKELFENEKLAWWIKRLGAFSVNRQKPEIATFKTVREVFKAKGWSLGIFPQGGIKDNRKIEDIQKGFAAIAQNAKADIIPVSIIGFEGYTKKPFSQNIIVKINKPISHTLPLDEIIYKWAKQICDDTGFENCMPSPVVAQSVEIAQEVH